MFKTRQFLSLFLLIALAPVFGQSVGSGSKKKVLRNVSLTINVVPSHATIIVDNAQIRGNSVSFPAGTHTILVKADGYYDYSATVQVNQDMVLPINLQPLMASLSIKLPYSPAGRHKRGSNRIQIYIDGNLQAGQSFQVSPGRHTIRIVTDNFQSESSFDAVAGQNYTVEPYLGIDIR